MDEKNKNEAFTYLILIGIILIISNIFNFHHLKNILIEFFKLLRMKINFYFHIYIITLSRELYKMTNIKENLKNYLAIKYYENSKKYTDKRI